MVNHVRYCTRAVRVHRRVAVAVSRLRDGRAAAAAPQASPNCPSATPGRQTGRFFTVRAGSLVAWRSDGEPHRPFRIVGGHTDSPNLRVKQHPDRFVSGWQVVALQPYGGAWLNSWLDRDLGISGRLSVRTGGAIDHRLIRIDEPILRVPQLAIHLAEDRKAVSLDPQRHVNAVWGVGERRPVVPRLRRRAGRGRRRRRARRRPDDPRPDPVDAGRCRRRAGQRAAAGQPGHLLRGAGGVPGRRAARITCRCWRCSTTRRSARSPITARSPSCCRPCWNASRWPRAAAARTSCAGCPDRWWPPATWRTPPTRTTPSATSRAT